jgi:hypothetical protein
MEDKGKWFELCALAAREDDPEKLIALVREINHLLDEKQRRLDKARPHLPDAESA